MAAIDRFFASAHSLPALPEVALKLFDTFGREQTTLGEVADLISKDTALSMRVLRMANSARYGMRRQVGHLQDAAALLGLDALRGLALTACLADAFPRPAGFDRRRLLACALIWFAIGHALSALMPGYAALLPVRALTMLAAAVFTPQAAAAISVMVPPEQRGRAITFVFLGWSVSSVLGMPLHAYIGEAHGWRYAFALVALLSAAVATLVHAKEPIEFDVLDSDATNVQPSGVGTVRPAMFWVATRSSRSPAATDDGMPTVTFVALASTPFAATKLTEPVWPGSTTVTDVDVVLVSPLLSVTVSVTV